MTCLDITGNSAPLGATVLDKSSTRQAFARSSIFDSQIRRFHEYNRHRLNVLHVIILHHRFRINPAAIIVPRTCCFAGKAAPTYRLAKLINIVGRVIDEAPASRGKIKDGDVAPCPVQ